MFKVYVKTDTENRITDINSDVFIMDVEGEGWVFLDEGDEWPKYMHASNCYLPLPVKTEYGIYRYKLANGEAVERNEKELEADRSAIPEHTPTQLDIIEAQVVYTAMMTDTFLGV